MINIITKKMKGVDYWVVDFRYAPIGFTPEEWKLKTDQLVAAGIIPKSKEKNIKRSKMTKSEVKAKAAAIINNVEDHDMSKDVLLVKDLLGEKLNDIRFDDIGFDYRKNANYLGRRFGFDFALNGSIKKATIQYEINICRKFVRLFGDKSWSTLNAQDCMVQLREDGVEQANDLETHELRLASSYGTFKRAFNMIKAISRYLAKFYGVKDVFADVILKDFPAPKTISEYKDSKNARTMPTNVDDVLYFAEQSYLKGIANRDDDTKKLWHEQLLLQIELFKRTGLRKGELIALTWDDLKLVEKGNKKFGTISVNKQFSRNTQTVSKPKTTKAIRIIPISFELYERIIAYKEIQIESELIFPNSVGKHDVRDRFGRALRSGNKEVHGDNKSKWLTVHGIRHFFATKFLNENHGSLDDLSVLLGHTDPRTTIQNYVDNRDIPADRLADIADRVGA